MSYANARRHYRVAQKEVAKERENGIFIPEKYNAKIIALSAALIIIIFIKGILIGWFVKSR